MDLDNSQKEEMPISDSNEIKPKEKTNSMLGPVIIIVATVLVAALGWFIYSSQSSSSDEVPVVSLGSDNGQEIIVGLSFDSLQLARWRTERNLMKAAIEAAGGSVVVAVADGDADLQVAQAKNLILQGVQVLIVVAVDAEKSAAIVEEAHRDNVKVIAYDRLIKNSELDYYLTFDNIKVGESQANGVVDAIGGKGKIAYIGGSPTDNNAFLVRDGSFAVLQPLIDGGDVELVLDKQVKDWDANLAYEVMSEFLNGGGSLDGAVVANDGMASGVIQALQEHDLAGKVKVSGQDAELRACRDVVNGNQTLTVYKPLKQLAAEAVVMSLDIIYGYPVETSETIDNGMVKVPARLLDVLMVTSENMEETVIADGVYTHEEVYDNL